MDGRAWGNCMVVAEWKQNIWHVVMTNGKQRRNRMKEAEHWTEMNEAVCQTQGGHGSCHILNFHLCILSSTKCYRAPPSITTLSTLTQPSQPQCSYVTSKCLTLLIPPSIPIPQLIPYKLILLLPLFQDTAAAWGSPATELRSRIAPVWHL